MSAGLSRRALIAAALTAPIGARAAPAPRLIALDWGWAATALALGVAPVGVAEQRLYRDWVGAPALPEGVAEVGLRTDPSLETLAALKPDLILTNALHAALTPRLQRLAPTLANPTFAPNRAPLANAETAARALGERLGRRDAADALIADAGRRLAEARERLRDWRGRALLPVSIIDRRHLTLHGDGGLLVDVLRAVGLNGLWTGPTSLWGHRAATAADLAGLPAGDLLVIDPLPPEGAAALAGSGLLARLCAAQNRTLYSLPAVWGFGDLTAAARFADLLAAALGRAPPA